MLRIGTVNYIDSLNPFNYVETQSTTAMMMIYPQLVQYGVGLKIEGDWASSWETSTDGKDWTFKLKPNTKWSDGKPMTAADAAWTINTTVKYASGPTAEAASTLQHVTSAKAIDDTTLVIHYESPVGNVLPQLEQFNILPQARVGADGRRRRQGPEDLPPGAPPSDRQRRRLHDHAVREEGDDRVQAGIPTSTARPRTPRASP